MGTRYITLLFAILSFSSNAILAQRSADQLQALYTFQEGAGQYVQDVSATGEPLMLKIANPASVQWIAGGGLQINQPTLIYSLASARKVNDASIASNELTIEAWIQPQNTTQDGPSRIVTMSHGTTNRNFMLAQATTRYQARMRTTAGDLNGSSTFQTGTNRVTTELQHIVFTHSSNGAERIYINGVQVANSTRNGDCSNWTRNFNLALANEINSAKPWLGKLFLVAVYSKALTAGEVSQNFQAGADVNGAPLSSAQCSSTTCFVDGFGATQRGLWLPGVSFPGGTDYIFDAEGGHFEVFPDGTAHLWGNQWNINSPGYGWSCDVWFTNKMNWQQWSALGRGWKGDANLVGNLYQTWDYYIMDPTKDNKLVGLGSFAGSVIQLSHKPSDYYYGLQVGVGANDKNIEPGMSVWFNATGQVNGVPFNGHGDFNLEGECVHLPVMQCLNDISVTCTEGTDPLVTGIPQVFCEESFSLNYSDAVVSSDCPQLIQRTWTAALQTQNATCVQQITLVDNEAPAITLDTTTFSGCDFDIEQHVHVSDDCDIAPSIVIGAIDTITVVSQDCNINGFRSQTQGGWGAPANGNNPGVYLNNHFAQAFPNGLTIGCGNNTLKLTSAQAVSDFLPSGITPALLPSGAMVDPGSSYSNVLAGQLVAATLNIGFDLNDAAFSSSASNSSNLIVSTGPFAGMTMGDVVAAANGVIGGCATNFSATDLNVALTSFNENFDNGSTNNGFLACPEPQTGGSQFTITITATDRCGNAASVTVPIDFVDTEAPVFLNAQPQLDVQCGQIPPASIDVVDNCGSGSVEVTVVETQYSGGCQPTIQRTFTAIDAQGNASTFVQFVHVHDTIAPQFASAPENLNLFCGDAIPAFEPVATDLCDSLVLITLDSTFAVNNCTTTIVRTWTASDGCGNTSSISQTITITDNSAPTVGEFVADVFAQCGETPSIEAPAFADACGTVNVEVQIQNSGAGCNATETRTYTATDACGNEAVAVQVIHYTDTVAPMFVDVPQDVALNCGEAVPTSQAIATDNCHLVNVSYSEYESNAFTGCSALVRTWTAIDSCGNTSVAEQHVTFLDNTAPLPTLLITDITAACGTNVPVPALSFTDDCDSALDVAYTEAEEQVGCTVVTTRTWTATDNCNNTTTVVQRVTLVDGLAPSISGPSQITLSCNELNNYTPEVSDDCSGVQLTHSDVVSGDDCNRIILRTWTATDGCGNAATLIQTISVVDNQAPQFLLVPANVTVACIQDTLPGVALAADNCDTDPSVSFTDQVIGSGCSYIINRTWRATDNCGNSNIRLQVITVNDNVPPTVLGVPANYTISCSNYLEPAVPTTVTATDNCSAAPQILYTQSTEAGTCANSFVLLRTWRATDLCGNTSLATQRITVVDNVPPVFDVLPNDITATCGNIPAPPTLTATDNCGPATVVLQLSNSTGGCPVITRRWIATDACGNTAVAVQRINIVDTQPPTVSGLPPGGNVSCNSIPPVLYPTAVDNCDDNVDISYNQTIVGNGCSYTLIRTFIAQDDCGNSTVVSQSFNVSDNVPPVFVNPQPSVTLSCTQLPGYTGPNATDGCSATVNRSFTDVVQGSGCNYTILRTYTASDNCGNSASFTQTLTIVDNVGPVLSGVPLSTFVSCSSIPGVPLVTATDACSGVVPVTFTQTTVGTGCSYQIQRRWTAVDACGNSTVRNQSIFVNDQSAPVFTNIPANVTIGCNEAMPAIVAPNVSDNCSSNVNVVYSEINENIPCGLRTIRRWTATDACGNVAFVTQSITRTDNEPPLLSGIPADIQVQCDAIPGLPAVTASDDCSGALSVQYSEQILPGTCPFVLVRTWSATDACGNTSSRSQQITVFDPVYPTLVGVPSDTTIQCSQALPEVLVYAEDNCTYDIQVQYTESEEVAQCVRIVHRTWTATDECGNTTSLQQVVHIEDHEAPIITSAISDMQVSCAAEVPVIEQLQVSDCSSYTVSTDTVMNGEACSVQGAMMRIWTVSDACGNTSSISQNIVILNSGVPAFVNEPTDVTVDCNSIPAVPQLVATDACGNALPVNFVEQVEVLTSDTSVCVLNNTSGVGGDVAVWLPQLPGIDDNFVFGNAPGTMVELPDGTLHITGNVYNPLNANQGWVIDVYLGNKKTWAEWSALGRWYKDDMNVAGDNYLDWSYYELLPTSRLIGTGAFTGAVLNLTHAPANLFYGFQLGVGANNHNAEYGLSGWFNYTGTFNNAAVSGPGDLMTENQCCPEQNITRTWTSTDCAGNTIVHQQLIHVVPTFTPGVVAPASMTAPSSFDVTGSSGNQFNLRFTMNTSGPVRIDLFEAQGQFIATVYSGTAEMGVPYSISYSKDGLTNGMYFFRLSQGFTTLGDSELVME
jgi:hypothetical protein